MAWTAPRTWVTNEVVTSSIMNTHVRDNFNAVLPIGSYILRAANYSTAEVSVESRWLQCNGVAVSRTTYADLFSYLNGLTPALPFGNGDGSTTFNLPDLRGRTPYGEGEHSSVDAMGDSDGQAIASREGARHQHNITTDGSNFGSGGFASISTPRLTETGGGGYLVPGSWFIKYTS